MHDQPVNVHCSVRSANGRHHSVKLTILRMQRVQQCLGLVAAITFRIHRYSTRKQGKGRTLDGKDASLIGYASSRSPPTVLMTSLARVAMSAPCTISAEQSAPLVQHSPDAFEMSLQSLRNRSCHVLAGVTKFGSTMLLQGTWPPMEVPGQGANFVNMHLVRWPCGAVIEQLH